MVWFFQSSRSRKSITLADISSSTVFERSSAQRALHRFLMCRRRTCTRARDAVGQTIRRSGIRLHPVSLTGVGGGARLGETLHGWRTVDFREANLLHGIQVI